MLSPEPPREGNAPRAEIYEAQPEGGQRESHDIEYQGKPKIILSSISAIEQRFNEMETEEAEMDKFR
jgi:hypothetical protein